MLLQSWWVVRPKAAEDTGMLPEGSVDHVGIIDRSASCHDGVRLTDILRPGLGAKYGKVRHSCFERFRFMASYRRRNHVAGGRRFKGRNVREPMGHVSSPRLIRSGYGIVKQSDGG